MAKIKRTKEELIALIFEMYSVREIDEFAETLDEKLSDELGLSWWEPLVDLSFTRIIDYPFSKDGIKSRLIKGLDKGDSLTFLDIMHLFDEWHVSDSKIMTIKGIGKKCADELQEILAKHNFWGGMNIEKIKEKSEKIISIRQRNARRAKRNSILQWKSLLLKYWIFIWYFFYSKNVIFHYIFFFDSQNKSFLWFFIK